MKQHHHIGFLIFLVIYSVFKYRAVPELMGQPAYIKSTVILVILTAVIPYAIAAFASAKASGTLRLILAGLLPLVLGAAGLATYFYLFIAPNAPGMSVMQVLPRSIVPGLVMGAILLLPIWRHRDN